MANPLQRLTQQDLDSMIARYNKQLVDLGPASTMSWSDGGHSDSVRTITVLEMLEILNAECDRRDVAYFGSGTGKAIFQ